MTGLSSKYPLLLKQWDYDKNNKDNIYPDKVSPGSNKKVWWTCKKGHSYKQGIYSKVKGSSCPFCSNKKILKGYNDLETLLPDVATEWNYNKNLLNPSDVGIGTAKKYWWICPNNHEYMEEVRQRAKGYGCPYCSGHRVYEGFNDLLTTHPELMKEWDYDKNTISPKSLSKGSRTQVWWKCEKGHSWQAAVYHRTKDRNCPICSGTRQTSFPEQAIYYYLQKKYKKVINRYKDIFTNGMELDIFIPKIKVGIEYDGRFYHNNKKSILREQTKYKICVINNIKLIRIIEHNRHETSNSDKCILCKWNNGNYSDLDNAINELFNYLNIKDIRIDSFNDKNEILNLYKQDLLTFSLKTSNPKLAEEWDYEKNNNLRPEMFKPNSGIKVWWKCEKGHSWQAPISKRNSGGHNCPYCSNQKILKGYNDLASLKPELLKEWDYKKNNQLGIFPENVSLGSSKKVWWKCEKGHSWQVAINKRTIGHRCPYCTNKIKKIN